MAVFQVTIERHGSDSPWVVSLDEDALREDEGKLHDLYDSYQTMERDAAADNLPF